MQDYYEKKKKDNPNNIPSSLSPRNEVQMNLMEGVKEPYEPENSYKGFWEIMQEKGDYLQSSDDYYESLKDTNSHPKDEQAWEDDSRQYFSKMPSAQYRARRLKRLFSNDPAEYQRILHLPPVTRMNTINKLTETSKKEWGDRMNGIAQDEDEYDNYYQSKQTTQEESKLNTQPIEQRHPQQQKETTPTPTSTTPPLPINPDEDDTEEANDSWAGEEMPDVADIAPYHEKSEQEKTELISVSTQNKNAQQLSTPDLHHSHQSETQDKETPSLVKPNHIQPANVYMTQEIPDNKPQTQENTNPSNKVKNTHPSPTQLQPNPESSKKESSEKKTPATPQFKQQLREGEDEEFNRIFDLNTSDHQEKRKQNRQQRQERINRQINETAKGAERKTGYQNTEEEATMVRKAIVAVQYTKDGAFVAVPDLFDPQKNNFYMLKLDTRLLFGDSAQERANEMVDLLYRLRMKEGDAQKILDMADKKERMRLIKDITANHRYANTPIALPTSGLAANVIRCASPAYIKATPEEKAKITNQCVNTPNVHTDAPNPYLLIKKDPHKTAYYEAAAVNRKAHGYDIVVPIGSPLELNHEAKNDGPHQWFSITQSVHGGATDWGLPEFKNAKGEIIDPKMNQVE